MISTKDLMALRSDGAVRLKGVISDHWIEELKNGIARNINDPSPLFKDSASDSANRGYMFDMWTRRRVPEFDAFLCDSGIAALAAECLGEPRARLLLDAWFSKPAGTRERTPWHQDIGVLGDYYTFWIALDPIPKSESLELISGSHRLNCCYMFERYFNTEEGSQILRRMEEACQEYHAKGGAHSDLAGRLQFRQIPDFESLRDDYEILSWDMDAGDCIIFHGMMLHSSAGNPGHADARRFLSRWAVPTAVAGPHGDVLKGAVEKTGYEVPLSVGEAFAGDMFPLLPERAA